MAKSNKQNALKGALYGAVAGAVASGVMDAYWGLARYIPGSRPEQKPKGPKSQQIKQEPSTQIVADKISEAITGHDVPKRAKPPAGVAVHYFFGSLTGSLYGLLASRLPGVGLLTGIMYGVGVWLFGDELTLRLLNIAPKASKVPPSQHLQALGAHLVYGSSLGLLTRLMLNKL